MEAKTRKLFDRGLLIDPKALKFIQTALLIVLSYLVLMTVLQEGFIFGIKHVLNIAVAVFITKELEILFYSHDRKLSRNDAKTFVKNDYALITALSLSILVPFNTPIVVVAIVAALAVFITKILFGGYVFQVFSPALFGYLLLKLGFANAIGAQTFDNQLFTALAQTNLFSNFVNFSVNYDFSQGFGLALSSGVFIFGVIALILMIKNFKQSLTPVLFIFLFVVFYQSMISSSGLYEHMMQVPFLFVTVFVLFDQVLIPTSRSSKILFAIILALMVNVFIIVGQNEAVVFASLFSFLFVPFFNQCKWFTDEDGKDLSHQTASVRKVMNYILTVFVLIAGIQLAWNHYSPNIGVPKVDVLQYFEDTYSKDLYTQNLTPTRDYNVGAYDTINGVYEVMNNDDQTLTVLIYDLVADGYNGPIHVVIAVDPYTDTIVGYVVVSQNETESIGGKYMTEAYIDTIINQDVLNFSIDEIAGVTSDFTFPALEQMVADVRNNYVNEEVSLYVQ